MKWNEYKRVIKMIGFRPSRNLGYFLFLGKYHWLWDRLKTRHREKAKEMGAIRWKETVCACPEFTNPMVLRDWIWWLLEQEDLDKELKEMIIEGVDM